MEEDVIVWFEHPAVLGFVWALIFLGVCGFFTILRGWGVIDAGAWFVFTGASFLMAVAFLLNLLG